MKDKKLRKGLIREWMLLAAALAAVAGVIFLIWHFLPSGKHEDLDAWFGSPAENEAAIVLEDSVYEGKAVLLEDRFFVPYELVQNLLNPRFYWDESVQEMLFTTADTLYEITPESTDYTGNGEKLETESPAVRYVEEQLYVDLDFLQERSDFTYDLLEEPKRVVITMGSQTVTEALLKKDAKIRTGAGIKRTILSDGKKGDAVTVLAVENKWARVRTADGMIGYVKEKTLKDVQEKTRESVYSGPEYTSLSMEGRLNLVWHGIYYEEANDLLEEDTKDMSWVNVISPTWYDLADGEGGVTSFASADYVKQAHKQGLQVWPLISNFGNGSSRAVLGNRASRKKLQEFLIDQARTLDFDGLNIDFEGLAETTGPSYVQFMRELSILCRKEQIYLSVDVAVPMPFSMFYNRKELGVICDYVIMMGYDEHYAGSETAGTVASLNFERTGIANMLKEVAKSDNRNKLNLTLVYRCIDLETFVDKGNEGLPENERHWVANTNDKSIRFETENEYEIRQAIKAGKSGELEVPEILKARIAGGSVTGTDLTGSIKIRNRIHPEKKISYVVTQNLETETFAESGDCVLFSPV